jgi:Ricin-type beta-trefoil lectin domain
MTVMPKSSITRVLGTLAAALPAFLDSGSRLPAQTPGPTFLLQVSPQGGGRCVETANREFAQGQRLEMQDCNNSPAQIFAYDQANLRLMIGGLCVDADAGQPGTLVKLSSCNGAANQVWKVEQKDGFSKLVGMNGLCFDIRYGSTSAGAQLQVWDCGEAEPNQLWRFSRR